ncbi:MAG: hypothetical protein KF745_10135 [Phycisphaeraceae bacterium]|nr:hypothetical protein [Phycisphaeraceae bacterium]
MPSSQPASLGARPAAPRQAGPPHAIGTAAEEPGVPQPTKNFSLTRFLFRGSVVGTVASVLVHLCFVLISAILLFEVARGGSLGGRTGGDVTITMETGAELGQLPGSTIEVGTPSIGEIKSGDDLPAGPALGGLSDSAEPGAGLGGNLGDIAGLRGGGDAIGDGDGLGGGGAGGGSAKFFGVEAKGSRFAYVCDVSGSMSDAGKLAFLKEELAESISSMMEHMSFAVCPFSSEAFMLGGRAKWTVASDEGKRWALAKIGDLSAQGGTNPGPAFEMIFEMKPRPEAIYFMTDGLFDASVAQQLAWLNRGSRRIPIHCIAFVSRDSELTMKDIAERSGGTYTFIEGPRRK